MKETVENDNKKNASRTIITGFHELDEMMNGFKPSELIILGSRPSIGKTSMALSILHHISVENNIPSAFFSLEMSNTILMQRLLSQDSKITREHLNRGNINKNFMHSVGRLNDAPISVVDGSNIKLLELCAISRRLRLEEKVEVIFIDYIGLIQYENDSMPRHEQISEISRALKQLACELDIPIIALSQITRSSEQTEPSLADLRKSSGIEQDADVIIFIHRERTSTDTIIPINTKLILAKHHNGVGAINISFVPAFAKFQNCDT